MRSFHGLGDSGRLWLVGGNYTCPDPEIATMPSGKPKYFNTMD